MCQMDAPMQKREQRTNHSAGFSNYKATTASDNGEISPQRTLKEANLKAAGEFG